MQFQDSISRLRYRRLLHKSKLLRYRLLFPGPRRTRSAEPDAELICGFGPNWSTGTLPSLRSVLLKQSEIQARKAELERGIEGQFVAGQIADRQYPHSYPGRR